MLYKALVVREKTTLLKMHYKTLEKSSGIACDIAPDISAALEMISNNNYDLIISGLHTTKSSGFELIKNIRSADVNVPIMIVTHHDTEDDILHALEIGADDYCVVPINPLIFIAKIKSLIRRYRASLQGVSNELVVTGPFSYNNVNLKIYKEGVEIPMSAKEHAIMKMFIDNADKVFSRAAIYNSIWGTSPIDENMIMVYINRIRSKIEDDPSRPKYLITIRNKGYKLVV